MDFGPELPDSYLIEASRLLPARALQWSRPTPRSGAPMSPSRACPSAEPVAYKHGALQTSDRRFEEHQIS